MDKIFLTLSFLAVVAGFIFLTEVTTGVGIIAIAGVFGIWTRIFQAQALHKEMMAKISERDNDSPGD